MRAARKALLSALLVQILALAGCASRPPMVLGVGGAAARYQVRLETLDGASHAFGRRLSELDAKLRAVYGTRLPPGEVWVDPSALEGQTIGGYYEWSSDRIVIGERDEGYLSHELIHRYNRFAFGELPRWLDEGIAYALARGGLEAPRARRPDFEAIQEVREAWEQLLVTTLRGEGKDPRPRSPGHVFDERLEDFPPFAGRLEQVFEDPYAHGQLDQRIATVIVDRLIRDRRDAASLGAALGAVVRAARSLSPAEARTVLERAAFRDLAVPEDGPAKADAVVLALLADETAPDDLVRGLLGDLLGTRLESAIRAAAPDPRARRRLALLLDRDGADEKSPVSNAPRRYLDGLLADPDPRVARAAVYALATRGERRMLGPLIDALEEAPIFRWVRPLPDGGVSYEAVPLQRTLAALAGEVPEAVREASSNAAPASLDEAEPPSYRTVAAWRTWFSKKN